MGGCATKPKVLEDDSDVKVKVPEPEPEPQTLIADETNVAQEPQSEFNIVGVDGDQINKRHSLSLLFNKENDETEASTENDKSVVEEIVKQETLEAQKPLEDSKTNEPIVKHESSKAEENQELKNEPLIKLEEKFPVQKESNNKPDEEIVKLEWKIETPKQEFVDANKNTTPSHGSKADKPETLIEETTVTKVALSTDAVSVPKIITDKATFGSTEEKNHSDIKT